MNNFTSRQRRLVEYSNDIDAPEQTMDADMDASEQPTQNKKNIVEITKRILESLNNMDRANAFLMMVKPELENALNAMDIAGRGRKLEELMTELEEIKVEILRRINREIMQYTDIDEVAAKQAYSMIKDWHMTKAMMAAGMPTKDVQMNSFDHLTSPQKKLFSEMATSTGGIAGGFGDGLASGKTSKYTTSKDWEGTVVKSAKSKKEKKK